MSIEVDNAEEKAVHSWSRLSSAGQKALEEALRVFNPMSKDLSDTETQLVAFLQGLREEGYQPTVLRSKDVYGYSSCTARMPSQAKGPGSQGPSSAASASESAEAPAASIARIAKVPAPLARVTVSPSEDSARPLSKSASATNLLLNSLKRTRSGTSRATAVGFPAHMYPGVYPAMRLSVVLEALVPLKATASCLESKCKQGHLEISPSDLKLLKAAGASRQPPAVRAPKVAPIQLDPRACRHLIKKRPEPAPLTVSLLKGPKGEGPKAGSTCKASVVLNGRLPGSASQSGRAAASRTKEPPASKAELPGGRSHREAARPKRRRPGEGQERPCQKKPSSPPSPGQTELASEASHLLEHRTIKVDRSSDDELRRRAQEILRVNLSPVIRIQPLPQPRGVP